MVEAIKEEPQPEQVEISFGTLFTVKKWGEETDRVDFVIDIGEKNYFFAASLQEDNEGRFWWSCGTAGPENFGRVVGQLTIEEVIEGKKRGCQKFGYEISDKELEILRESAKKGSRIINLKPLGKRNQSR